MKTKVFCIIIFLCFMLGKNSNAQNPFIDSVKILTAHPTTEKDTVKVALYVWTSAPGKVLFLNHTVTPGVIYIRGCYSLQSGISVPEFYNDTVTIGTLPEGTYSVEFTAYWSAGPTSLYTDSNKRTMSLIVAPPVSINLRDFGNTIRLYPNPVQDILNLNLPTGTTLQKTEIHDMQGRLLRSYHGKEPIDVADLPKGLYMLLVETDKGRAIKRFSKE
jgi:hypothetical protein